MVRPEPNQGITRALGLSVEKAITSAVRTFQARRALFCSLGRAVITPYDVIWRPPCCHYEEAADALFFQARCNQGRAEGWLKSLAPAFGILEAFACLIIRPIWIIRGHDPAVHTIPPSSARGHLPLPRGVAGSYVDSSKKGFLKAFWHLSCGRAELQSISGKSNHDIRWDLSISRKRLLQHELHVPRDLDICQAEGRSQKISFPELARLQPEGNGCSSRHIAPTT
jgi:hypothetical protein